MALPFTDEQRQKIRALLFESAQRRALSDGYQFRHIGKLNFIKFSIFALTDVAKEPLRLSPLLERYLIFLVGRVPHRQIKFY